MRNNRFILAVWWGIGLCVAGCQPTTAPSESAPQANAQSLSLQVPANAAGATAGPSDKTPAAQEGVAAKKVAETIPVATEVKAPLPPSWVVEPSAEQVARWQEPAYEALRLAALRKDPQAGFVSELALSAETGQIVSVGTKLILWPLASEGKGHVLWGPATDSDEEIKAFAISSDGKWCLTGDGNGLLRQFDLVERKQSATKQTSLSSVAQLAISPDGQEIAAVPYDKEVTIWNGSDLSELRKFELDTRGVERLMYIAPKRLLAAGQTMSLWNTETGEKIEQYPAANYNLAVAASADGKELIFGVEMGLQRWSMQSGSAAGLLPGGFARDEIIRYSPDGTWIATANANLVRIWDAGTSRLMQILDASGNAVTDIQWAPHNSLLVSSENGALRLWARFEEAKRLGISDASSALEQPSLSEHKPASTAELLRELDLRLLPMPSLEIAPASNISSASYESTAKADELKTFYRYLFGKRGWKVRPDEAAPDDLRFEKNGFWASINVFSSEESKSYVNLVYLGNYDVRETPKLKDMSPQLIYEGMSGVNYKVKGSLLDIEVGLLQSLSAAGWTAITRLNASHDHDPSRRDLEFVKHGSVLRVFVQPDPMESGIYHIQYGASLSLHSLPVPPDAGLMEWDDFQEAQMVANTAMSLEEAIEFFDKSMAQYGWAGQTQRRRIEKDLCYLPYTCGQRETTIALFKTPRNLVRIITGKYSDRSWQVLPGDSKESSGASSQSEEDVVQAADVILFDVKGPANFDSPGSSIAYELSSLQLADTAQKHQQAFEKLGWKTEEMGEINEQSHSLIFKKGEKTIYYHSRRDPRNVGQVQLSGDGLGWTKTIPTTDLIPYSAWLRNQRLPASLNQLEAYEAEMRKLLDGKELPKDRLPGR